ncbi:B3/B4 domain-containing protein [Aquincola tertiaricarbonis]|uniref:B3/B4 domain-containing protein n=1 Tax=Aquincola tertiaricarbonis TaxID=391953 RepID=UPI000614D915|nr:phenylalanine--tRNA ligase beta subunit-related protein [Aquincola tertiaricarbonis]
MQFFHSPAVWAAHPTLVCGALAVGGITPLLATGHAVAPLHAMARERLQQHGEGELPEIQAWRRAFSAMGHKPTQVRCAAESLLRRFRKEGTLPTLHPLVDLCNAVSLGFAVPIAVFDLDQVAGPLVVRPADGSESYLSFAGELEQPEPGEIVFADALRRAHARRWCHRQSATSAVQPGTARALIVAEALHAGAEAGMPQLLACLAEALAQGGAQVHARAVLSAAAPVFHA